MSTKISRDQLQSWCSGSQVHSWEALRACARAFCAQVPFGASASACERAWKGGDQEICEMLTGAFRILQGLHILSDTVRFSDFLPISRWSRSLCLCHQRQLSRTRPWEGLVAVDCTWDLRHHCRWSSCLMLVCTSSCQTIHEIHLMLPTDPSSSLQCNRSIQVIYRTRHVKVKHVYDCDAGFKNWKYGWSSAKQSLDHSEVVSCDHLGISINWGTVYNGKSIYKWMIWGYPCLGPPPWIWRSL